MFYRKVGIGRVDVRLCVVTLSRREFHAWCLLVSLFVEKYGGIEVPFEACFSPESLDMMVLCF